MAKIVFTLGTIVGSIGGLTFQENGSGYIIRRRPQPNKSSTTLQQTAHQNLQNWLNKWQGLTDTNRMNWNTFAGLNPKTNKFGQVKNITGANWFMSVNYMRILQSLSQLNDPPTYTLPHSLGTWDVSTGMTTISITGLNTFDYTDTSYIIWTTLLTTRSKPTINQIRKYLGIVSADPGATYDITTLWNTATKLTYSSSLFSGNAKFYICLEPVCKSSGITGALECKQFS